MPRANKSPSIAFPSPSHPATNGDRVNRGRRNTPAQSRPERFQAPSHLSLTEAVGSLGHLVDCFATSARRRSCPTARRHGSLKRASDGYRVTVSYGEVVIDLPFRQLCRAHAHGPRETGSTGILRLFPRLGYPTIPRQPTTLIRKIRKIRQPTTRLFVHVEYENFTIGNGTAASKSMVTLAALLDRLWCDKIAV